MFEKLMYKLKIIWKNVPKFQAASGARLPSSEFLANHNKFLLILSFVQVNRIVIHPIVMAPYLNSCAAAWQIYMKL